MGRHLFSVLLATTAFAAAPGWATTVNGAYSFTVIDGDSRGLAFQPNVPIILEDGTVVYVQGNASTSATAPRHSVVFLGDDGSRREVVLPGVTEIGQISANDAGQFAAIVGTFNSSSGNLDERLVFVDTDGTAQTLLETDGLTGSAVPTRRITDIQINASGTVAAFATVETSDPDDPFVQRVLRIEPGSAGAPTIDILDESRRVGGDPNFRDLPGGVTIDDEGRIGWRVTLPGQQQVLVDDGTGAEFVYNTSNLPVLNNEGEALVIGPFPRTGVGTTDVTDGVLNDFAQVASGDGCAPGDLNDYGQVVCLSNDGRLLLDGVEQLRVGDVIDGLEIASFTSGGGPRLVTGEGLNDSGQIVIEATLVERDANGVIISPGFESGMVRLDPTGATPDNPILPSSAADGVFGVGFDLVNALGVEDGSPIYVDPVFGTGLSYTITNGGPNFTSLTVPSQDLGGLSMFDIVFGSFSERLGFGETLDFTQYLADGISTFEIFGSGGLTSDQDFVAGFTFADLGRVELDITNVTRDIDNPDPGVVPLPAGAWLFLGALGTLASLRRKLL